MYRGHVLGCVRMPHYARSHVAKSEKRGSCRAAHWLARSHASAARTYKPCPRPRQYRHHIPDRRPIPNNLRGWNCKRTQLIKYYIVIICCHARNCTQCHYIPRIRYIEDKNLLLTTFFAKMIPCSIYTLCQSELNTLIWKVKLLLDC